MTLADTGSSYDIATLVIAIAGFGLALVSLAWQASTYFLTGSRLRAALLLGATDGSVLITYPPDKATPETIAMHAKQGFTKPVVVAEVRNIGRMPATVQKVTAYLENGVGLQPLQHPHAPLPYRLEAGSSESWWIDATAVASAAARLEKTRLSISVELGTGKVVRTKSLDIGERVEGGVWTRRKPT